MSTLIVYASQHGCTEQSALKLHQALKDDVALVNLKENARIDPEPYDTIIIGGSIHAGRIQKVVRAFYQIHADVLQTKRLGLFLCCMKTGDSAQKEFNDVYPEILRNHAIATGLFGGAFDFNRMNFMEKAIVKKVAKVTESVSNINEEAIRDFIHQIN